MLSNLPALKIVSTLTMCISSQRRFMGSMKRPDPLGPKCDTITSPRRLVITFMSSNSTEFRMTVITIPKYKL
jgi:hypothetical protein